mgnify:CR=1 FL=1
MIEVVITRVAAGAIDGSLGLARNRRRSLVVRVVGESSPCARRAETYESGCHQRDEGGGCDPESMCTYAVDHETGEESPRAAVYE